MKKKSSPKNKQEKTTLLYSVKALDSRAFNIETEITQSFDAIKRLAVKSPKKCEELTSRATNFFQTSFIEQVPLPEPIYFRAKTKGTIKWQSLINSLLFPKLSPLSALVNKYVSSWVAAIRNSKIDVTDLGKIVIPDSAFADQVETHLGKGSTSCVWEAIFGIHLVGDNQGLYSEVPDHEETSGYTVTVTRGADGTDAHYTYTKTGKNDTRTEHYDSDGKYDRYNESGKNQDTLNIQIGYPIDPRVQAYIERNPRHPPKGTPTPDSDPVVTEATIETIMSLAIFRQEANQILRSLEIKGGSPVDVERKNPFYWRQILIFDAAFHNFLKKAFQRHMEAERNKFGLLEEKPRVTGTFFLKQVGFTDPPNMSINVK